MSGGIRARFQDFTTLFRTRGANLKGSVRRSSPPIIGGSCLQGLGSLRAPSLSRRLVLPPRDTPCSQTASPTFLNPTSSSEGSSLGGLLGRRLSTPLTGPSPSAPAHSSAQLGPRPQPSNFFRTPSPPPNPLQGEPAAEPVTPTEES